MKIFNYSSNSRLYRVLDYRQWNLPLESLRKRYIFLITVVTAGMVLIGQDFNFLTLSFRSSIHQSIPAPIFTYNFSKTHQVFNGERVGVINFKEFNLVKFEEVIDQKVPKALRSNFKKYAPLALEFSQKYNLDPFWVLSIMWTESHFKKDAVSYVGARGLMQIMPRTAVYLTEKIKKENFGPYRISEYKEFDRPEYNIEMGVYYLRYLLQRFEGDIKKATVAYNVGPTRLSQLMRRETNRPNLSRNRYYRKVRRAYRFLTRNYNRI